MFSSFKLETLSKLCFLFLGTSYLFSQLFFAIGLSISQTYGFVVIGLSLILSNIILRERKFIYNACLFALTVLLFLVAQFYIDQTWDGQAYHQEMTLRMAQGWNPYGSQQGGTWVYHYPKAYETLGVFFYQIFGTIKAIKMVNLFIFVTLFLYTFSYLKQKFRRNESLLIAIAIAFNPVLLGQLTSNLVDGFLYAIAVIMVVAYLQWKSDKRSVIDFFLALIILINIKFTGVIFAIAIAGYIFLKEWITNKETRKQNITRLLVVGLLGSFFLYTPYIKNNLIENGHVFHPLMGKNSSEFHQDYVPDIIKPYSPFQRVILSNFVTVCNRSEGAFKIPFTFSITELQRFRNGGPRGGSFGVWWSGILVLSLLYYFFGILKHRKEFKISHYELITVCILILTFANAAGWWFRYTPFIWLIPLFFLLSIKRYQAYVLPERGLFAIALINGLLTLSISMGAKMLDTKRFERKILQLKNEQPVSIDFGNFYGNKFLLKEYGIEYVEKKRATFTQPTELNSEVFFERTHD